VAIVSIIKTDLFDWKILGKMPRPPKYFSLLFALVIGLVILLHPLKLIDWNSHTIPSEYVLEDYLFNLVGNGVPLHPFMSLADSNSGQR
jgi:hypothetical protein